MIKICFQFVLFINLALTWFSEFDGVSKRLGELWATVSSGEKMVNNSRNFFEFKLIIFDYLCFVRLGREEQ